MIDLTCNRGSVGQSEGLSIPRSSVRFCLKPDNSNSHELELHRPSNKGTKLLLKVIKAIIIIQCHVEIGSVKISKHDNLCEVRREQEKFRLLGGCVPVTKVQVVSF